MFWALFALCAFLYVVSHPKKFLHNPSPILALVSIGLLFRLIPALIFVPTSNFDIDSYRLVGQHVVAGENVYITEDTTRRYPYLPFQMYWSGLSHTVSEKTHIPFSSFVRLAPIGADILIGLLIFKIISKTSSKKYAFWSSLLFLVNPLAIYVSAYHGQFDAIPIMMILFSFIYAGENHAGLSGFWLGLGVLTKSWPILAFPQGWIAFRNWKKKLIFALIVGLVPLADILIYDWIFKAQFFTVIKRAISYNNGIGVWGYTYLLRLLGFLIKDFQPILDSYFSISKYITLLLLGITWLLIARKQKIFSGMLTLFVSFFAFTHAFSIQYLIWLVPFAIIDNQVKWLKWYTLAAFSYMFLAYHTLILRTTITQLIPWPQADVMLIIPAGLATWCVTVAWIWSRCYFVFKIRNQQKYSNEIDDVLLD